MIAYIIDTPRTASTSTFMSNMLYACSILYKTKLPMILVFNKTDVKDASFAREWMTDYDAFQEALSRDEASNAFGGVEGGEGGAGGGGGSGYMGSLLNSMSLVLAEFYAHLSVVGVSSMTGAGVDDFFAAVRDKADEFRRDYRPELERRRREREDQKRRTREKELEKMMRGMSMATTAGGSSGSGVAATAAVRPPRDGGHNDDVDDEMDISDDQDDDDDDDDDDEDYADADDEYDREGLQARYEAAMEASKDSTMDDASFAKFLHSQRH